MVLLTKQGTPQDYSSLNQKKKLFVYMYMYFIIKRKWSTMKGCRIVFGFFLPQVLICFWLSFPVPFALYLQQFGTRTCHFAWYLIHFGMVTLHFAWYLLHLAVFAFHFAWYLSHFGISTSHLHGICYILVLQTFMWVSWGFFRLFHLGFHLGFL